ncbi:MAG TPA: hypothetical protein VFM68_03285 [Candidatus Saccharimonadales bacterium]|nr:hypothetical protein [Candidatus Saccharimonadales bacterium]
MYKSSSSKVLPIILVLIVVAIAIAALVSVGRAIFGGDDTSQSQVDLGEAALVNISVDRSVRMNVRGPIVADEKFNSYQVAVDSSSRRLTTYSGYHQQTIDSLQFGNNVQAYEEFVYALSRANLMKGEELSGAKDDTRGICANGLLYEFEVLQGSSVVKRLWTSTCKGSPGSLRASTEQVSELFLDQIPESEEALDEIDLKP